MAFTVEPRLTSATLPLSSFHVIVTFLEGRKRVQSGFRALFELFGMDGYLPTTGLAG